MRGFARRFCSANLPIRGRTVLLATQSCLNIDQPTAHHRHSISKLAIYHQQSKHSKMAAQTDSLRKFAILATKAKMHAKAEELWQRLVDANDADGAARYNIANAQSALGKLDAALTHYDAAIRETDDAALQGLPRERVLCLY